MGRSVAAPRTTIEQNHTRARGRSSFTGVPGEAFPLTGFRLRAGSFHLDADRAHRALELGSGRPARSPLVQDSVLAALSSGAGATLRKPPHGGRVDATARAAGSRHTSLPARVTRYAPLPARALVARAVSPPRRPGRGERRQGGEWQWRNVSPIGTTHTHRGHSRAAPRAARVDACKAYLPASYRSC